MLEDKGKSEEIQSTKETMEREERWTMMSQYWTADTI